MKKMLFVLVMVLAPSSAFALIGFGIQAGSDLSKLGPYSYSEGEVTINTYEMKSNPAGIGAYAFVDLFGFALEGEADFAGGQYEFDFGNKAADSEFSIYYAAHYADVHHQVEKIEEGARLVLIYNLIQPIKERQLSANHHKQLLRNSSRNYMESKEEFYNSNFPWSSK